MNILFDISLHYINNKAPSHGGNEYSKAVLFRLLEEKTNHNIYALFDSEESIEKSTNDILEQNNILLIDIRNRILTDIIKEFNINTFFSPSGLQFKNLDFSQIINFKYIFTIHGVRKIILPHDIYEPFYCTNLFSLLLFFYKIMFTSLYRERYIDLYKKVLFPIENKILITVSEHSKYSFISYFPQISDKINVFFSPLLKYILPSEFSPSDLIRKYSHKSYYLIVSAGIWEKNSYRAIMAFNKQSLIDANFDKTLLVIGSTSKLIRLKFRMNNRIQFIPYVDRDTLEYLYYNAFGLLYPSLREGFGYPPLEAMKYGTLVLSSGIDPMISNLGSGVLYFNPYAIEDIRVKIVESYYSKNIYSDSQIAKRVQSYNEIHQKQNDDLNRLIKLILYHN